MADSDKGEIRKIGEQLKLADGLLVALEIRGLQHTYQLQAWRNGSIATTGSDLAPFLEYLAADPQSSVEAGNEATLEQLALLMTLARPTFEASARKATAAVGVGPLANTPSTEDNDDTFALEMQRLYATFSQFCNIMVPVADRLSIKELRPIRKGLEKQGMIHSCVWSFQTRNATTEDRERRTSLGGGAYLVQEEMDTADANLSGTALLRVYRVMVALATVGQRPVSALDVNPTAYTRATTGYVLNEAGQRVMWYVHWSDLMSYFVFLVGLSAKITTAQLKFVHGYIWQAVSDHMVTAGTNVSSALVAVRGAFVLATVLEGYEGPTLSEKKKIGAATVTVAEFEKLKSQIAKTHGGGGGGGGANRNRNRSRSRDRAPTGGRGPTDASASPRRAVDQNPQRCNDFNTRMGCPRTNCRFIHKCSRCGSRDHGATFHA
jgi:hypothetical protein